MCRLFALHADRPVTASFWLLDAPYSLAHQSRFNADGTGIGWFDEAGRPHVAKKPVAAYTSRPYARIASSLTSRAMIAHVRNSSGTASELENTHPFLMRDILFAHNGVLRVTEAMRGRVRGLGTADLIQGETDSEWFAALVAGETAAHGESLRDGIVAAVNWVLENVEVFSLNIVAARDEQVFALRMPEVNELWVREREPGGRTGEGLHQVSDTLEAASEDLREVRSVVIASEPMDDSDQWRLLEVGELIHLTPQGEVRSEQPFGTPRFKLELEQLGLSEANSQAHAAEAKEREQRRARWAEQRRRRKVA
jgi:glutamine amidotransferase